MQIEQRPWVAATIEPVSLDFDDQGGAITIKTIMRNAGVGPATDVLPFPALIYIQQPYKAIDVIRKECSQWGIGGGHGYALFKDDKVAQIGTTGMTRAQFGNNFPLFLNVCVKYRFANSGAFGQSGYLFDIVRRDAPRQGVYAVETKNGSIAPPVLDLLPMGSYAD